MRGVSFFIAAMFLSAGSAAEAAQQPICPDRPSKSTGPCIVPQGKLQIETGLIDWTRDRSGDLRTDTTQWGGTLVKYGLSDRADIELGLIPLETVHIRGTSVRERHSSFGDTVVRVKYRLNDENAPVQVALDPFVKIPTATRKLGNGKVEGGLVVPVAIPLGQGPLTLSLDPELDLLADDDRRGRHLATQQVVNLGLQVNDKLGVSAELWGEREWDPAGTRTQVSADGAVAYLVSSSLQLDGGVNLGLNRRTPDVELYTGVSARF